VFEEDIINIKIILDPLWKESCMLWKYWKRDCTLTNCFQVFWQINLAACRSKKMSFLKTKKNCKIKSIVAVNHWFLRYGLVHICEYLFTSSSFLCEMFLSAVWFINSCASLRSAVNFLRTSSYQWINPNFSSKLNNFSR